MTSIPDLSDGKVSIWFDLPFEEYTALKGVNSSRLKHLDHSPRAFIENPQTIGRRSASIGHMAHCMMLEPDEVKKRYVPSPEGLRRDKRTKAYKEFLNTVPECAESVAPAEFELAADMVEHAENYPLAWELIKHSTTELTVQWIDEETEVLCKARFDMANKEKGLIDLKTTKDVTPKGFKYEAKKYGYWSQAAHYRAGLRAINKSELMQFDSDEFRIIAVDNQEGERYTVVFKLPAEVIDEFAVDRYNRIMQVKQCKEEGNWPGPDLGAEQVLEFPGQAFRDTENDSTVNEEIEGLCLKEE